MKIVEVIPSLDILGGAEVLFSNLCIELNKNKENRLYVVCLYDGISENVSMKFRENNIELFKCSKHVGIDFAAARKFKNIIKKIKPDIVHMHLDCITTIFFSGCFANKNIIFFHTCHTVAYNDLSKCTRRLAKFLINKGRLNLVGISNAISKTICDIYKLNKCYTVYNGTKLFKNSIGLEKKYDFITVASFSPNKNQAFIIETFSKFVELYPNARMIFLGDGSQLENCKKIAISLKLQNNVEFVGYTTNVEKYISKSKYFILASGYEGNPISIIEAMSSGLNIIATRVGGIPDVVTNLENGYLFAPNSLEELLNIMTFVFQHPESYLPIAERNIEKAKNYSIEVCANDYINIFKRYSR